MSTPARHQVRQSFERAAATYDQAAGVQRLACKILAEQLPQSLSATPRLLDAGCGTGYALPLLQAFAPTAEVLALDLAPAMLARAHAATARIQGDLECLPLATACIDLYWSSLAWQWCDPARALAEARRVLRPGGYFLLCSLGPATFTELRQAFAAVDDYPHTFDRQTGFRNGRRKHYLPYRSPNRRNGGILLGGGCGDFCSRANQRHDAFEHKGWKAQPYQSTTTGTRWARAHISS